MDSLNVARIFPQYPHVLYDKPSTKVYFTSLLISKYVYSSQGEKYGWNQAQCDQAFKRDMYKLCEKSTRKRWFFTSVVASLINKVKRCKTYGANVYYRAVATFGHLYWAKNPPSWCSQACAKNHGDPYKLLNV